MLIHETITRDRRVELHHLGKLELHFQIINPEPKIPTENYRERLLEEEFIAMYEDYFLQRSMQADFYLTYEKRYKRKKQMRVSFSRPDAIFRYDEGARRSALSHGFVPWQHPAVLNNEYPIGQDPSPDGGLCYQWEYVLEDSTGKRRVEGLYDQMVSEENHASIVSLIPFALIVPLLKNGDMRILRTLNLQDAKLENFERLR